MNSVIEHSSKPQHGAAKSAAKSADNSGSANSEHILPVKKPGPIIAGVIVAIIACSLLYGIVTNPRFEWQVVGIYLISDNVLAGIGWTLLLTVFAMVIA
ncbi:hypothetical protein ACMZ9F_04035, partial [Gardnerella vaginalis]